MLKQVVLIVNGNSHKLEIDVGETLLEVLRERLHLTGAKEGCDVGECGACTVLVEGVPLNACLYLGVWADGQRITTVEGLADGNELSKVQKAFVSEGAVQCGFCTPGLVITASAMVAGGKSYSREEIRQELAGHLCRCTGYQKIISAVEKALKD